YEEKLIFLSVWLPVLYLKGLIEQGLLHPVGLLLVGSQPVLVQTLDLPAHTHSVGISITHAQHYTATVLN
ncbi:MAG: hypothetical protein ACK55I_22570, partial [bacterium]